MGEASDLASPGLRFSEECCPVVHITPGTQPLAGVARLKPARHRPQTIVELSSRARLHTLDNRSLRVNHTILPQQMATPPASPRGSCRGPEVLT
jgi:hypothetical protein